MSGPSNANAGRSEYFRTTMGTPAAIAGIVVGASVALLAGAYFGGVPGAIGAPVAVVVAILAGAFWLADRRAEAAFWKHVAASLGFQPFWDETAVETTTPLLHAGDRRFWKHQIMGPLGDSGLTARLCLYRFDVRKENSKGEDSWDSYHWTICLVEGLDAGMELFPGIYLRQRRGLMGLLGGHDWLRGRSLHDVELESTQFNETYELKVVKNQDEGRLRELFDPKTIVWLTEHPLRPQIEYRAGFLVVYVPDHLDDLGNIVWLLEATERIAERVQAEIGESQATIG